MAFHKLPIQKKISTKLIIITAIWLFVSMLTITFTISLLWNLEATREAINDAGNLRMYLYRIALLSHEKNKDEDEFQQELITFTRVLDEVIKGDSNQSLMLPKDLEIRKEAKIIGQLWHATLFPQLQKKQYFLTHESVDSFVTRIDFFVAQLEIKNIRMFHLLRFYQYCLITLIIAGSITMLFFLFILVIRPLKRLNFALLKIEEGDFSHREDLNLAGGEFGILSIGYNQMANKLSELYKGLEQKVEEKTIILQNRNEELNYLYTITSFLHQNHDIKKICNGFLEQIMAIADADAGAIRLFESQKKKMNLVAEINLIESQICSEKCSSFSLCFCGKFASAVGLEKEGIIELSLAEQKPFCITENYQLLQIFSIINDYKKIGIITLFFNDKKTIKEDQKHLLLMLNNQLGIAIGGVYLMENSRRIAVLEERNLMAQDLHDSIAQILSYLNWQVHMLEKALKYGKKQEAEENLGSIKNGVKECYENVRELLHNFRSPIKTKEFPHHLNELIRRFKTSAGIGIKVTFDESKLFLSEEESLEVIFIIQEGLSNIRKHAEATEVSLTIERDKDLIIQLEDNGKGFNHAILKDKASDHIGISIMKERAKKINAKLTMDSILNKGTQLTLTISDKNENRE